MEGKGLYEEYCDHFPMVQGYRELNYTEWLENELLKLREEVNKNCNTPAVVKSVCPNCGTGKENHVQLGDHVHCRTCDHEWNWG